MNPIFEQIVQQFQLPLQSPILIFALILLIILLVPLLFERIRTPDIIGLILCGIAIGPHGFNILEQDLFVDIFSTIGLMYIMFLAGLEINLVEFKFNRNKSLVFALFTFTFPFALGIPVCFYLLQLDIHATLLVASIFATHTLITYPIVNRHGITSDRSVAIAVGGTIVTDSAVLVILAMILGAHEGELSAAFWTQLGISLVLFSLVMFVVVPRIAKAFFHRMQAHQHAHYIFVMVVVFLAAFLAEVAGLEGIIGAFAAGLALNKYIPSSSALMNRTAFIGNSLFIPFFLISVGMLVDVKIIASGYTTLLVAAALTVTAFAGKYIAARSTQRVFGLSRPQGSLIFGLSSAHAAATLAVVLVGYKAGIVDDNIINAIVIVILVSCVLASFITEGAAQKLMTAAEGDGGGASAEQARVDRELGMEQILVPLSNLERARRLLTFATLVKDRESSHPLAVLRVVANTSNAEKEIAEARNAMDKIREEASGADVEVSVLATMDGSVARGIARTSREIAADLILVNAPLQSGALAGMASSGNAGSLLYHTDKLVFICDFQHAITAHTGIFIILPQFTEFMPGFATFIDKMARLATELSVPVKLRCNRKTHEAVAHWLEKNSVSLDLDFREFNDWRDFFVLFRKLDDLDLLVLAAGRRGTLAHHPSLDDMPARLGRHFPGVSRILAYP